MLISYWYPMNGWAPGTDIPSEADVDAAAQLYQTLGVTTLVLGIDGRKLSTEWDYLQNFDSTEFRADLETTLDRLYAAGFTGEIQLMPINGLENWKTAEHQRAFWMVEATLSFIAASAHQNHITGLVTDTEFAATTDWQQANVAGQAAILQQYITLLEGVKTRVQAAASPLTTATYHGAFLDTGDTRFEVGGVNYGNSAVLGAPVDFIILPIRLTDLIDPGVNHDFDLLVSLAQQRIADELAHLANTTTRVIVDFEWEEAEQGIGAPNFFRQLTTAIGQAVTQDPAFAGLAVFIDPTISTVPLSGLNITGSATSEVLDGTAGQDSIDGGAGDDTLNGGAENDTLIGGTGADSMVGGPGDDTYEVDNPGDAIVEQAGEGTDHVQSSISVELRQKSQNLENLTLTGNADIDGTGNSQANIITGNSGNNVLNGAWGDDTLIGGAGNDTFLDDNGADRMEGGSGDDTYTIEPDRK